MTTMLYFAIHSQTLHKENWDINNTGKPILANVVTSAVQVRNRGGKIDTFLACDWSFFVGHFLSLVDVKITSNPT